MKNNDKDISSRVTNNNNLNVRPTRPPTRPTMTKLDPSEIQRKIQEAKTKISLAQKVKILY